MITKRCKKMGIDREERELRESLQNFSKKFITGSTIRECQVGFILFCHFYQELMSTKLGMTWTLTLLYKK